MANAHDPSPEPLIPEFITRTKGTVAASRIQRADGPWAQAWKRLRRNRMAMAGLVVVVLMLLATFGAPLINRFDPREMERWTGALPPGTRHLELQNEMAVTRGARPRDADLPRFVADTLGDGKAHVWVLTIASEESTTLRVTIDGGTITQIGEGGRRHTKIDLAADETLRVKDGGAALAVRTIEVGGALPAPAPQEQGRFVVMLDRLRRSAESRRTDAVRFGGDGTVASVTRGGAAVEGEHRIRAEDVADATFDGARVEHTHLLGTDQEGRDVLVRVLYGGQISLMIGLVGTLVALTIGVFWGATAGYAGGRTDVFMMRVVDVLYAMPYIFLVIIVVVTFGRSIYVLFAALGAVGWLTTARVVRGQILSLKRREFVDAAVTLGTPSWKILVRHLVPNTMGIVVVFATLTIPTVILEESFLAFIGLTVQRGGQAVDSWGALVDYGRNSLGAGGDRWWLLVLPSVAMSVTLFSFNFLGDGLRDALDPQQKGRG